MISLIEAMMAFLAWMSITVAITCLAFGEVGLIIMAPIWGLSLVYPFTKSLIDVSRTILGIIGGFTVFLGWAAVNDNVYDLGQVFPLFCATMSWTIYCNIISTTQVSRWPPPPPPGAIEVRARLSDHPSRIFPTMKRSESGP